MNIGGLFEFSFFLVIFVLVFILLHGVFKVENIQHGWISSKKQQHRDYERRLFLIKGDTICHTSTLQLSFWSH